jgi:GTP cyclohydrolase II
LEPDAFLYSEAEIPTDYGSFRVLVFHERNTPHEHVAIVKGEVAGKSDVLCRVHSECFTGEVLHSLKCECREQLDFALKKISAEGAGMVLYLRQEGRGIGLGNKIRAYALQAQGADTVDANRMLGFADDLRRYHVATVMLRELGVRSVALMTNNPSKVKLLRADGVVVSSRVPVRVALNDLSRAYVATKRARMGHLVDAADLALEAAERTQSQAPAAAPADEPAPAPAGGNMCTSSPRSATSSK